MVNLDQANVNVLMWPEHDGRSMQEHVRGRFLISLFWGQSEYVHSTLLTTNRWDTVKVNFLK